MCSWSFKGFRFCSFCIYSDIYFCLLFIINIISCLFIYFLAQLFLSQIHLGLQRSKRLITIINSNTCSKSFSWVLNHVTVASSHTFHRNCNKSYRSDSWYRGGLSLVIKLRNFIVIGIFPITLATLWKIKIILVEPSFFF